MNKYYFFIQYYSKLLFRLFFSIVKNGYECEICGRKTFKTILCNDCLENNFKNKLNVIPSPVFSKNNGIIKNLDEAFCLFPYDLWNKNLLFKWKITNERSLSFQFATIIYHSLKNLNIKNVVPVPPRPGKIKEKGWDQIDELCNFLEFFFDIKILRILERKNKLQMKKLNRENRLKISSESYCLKEEKEILKIIKKEKMILPTKICLLDDVMTTGATLESCSSCLKKGGAKEVSAITLFYV